MILPSPSRGLVRHAPTVASQAPSDPSPAAPTHPRRFSAPETIAKCFSVDQGLENRAVAESMGPRHVHINRLTRRSPQPKQESTRAAPPRRTSLVLTGADDWLLASAVRLSFDDKLPDGVFQMVDGGLGEEQIGHDRQPLNRVPVRGEHRGLWAARPGRSTTLFRHWRTGRRLSRCRCSPSTVVGTRGGHIPPRHLARATPKDATRP